MDAWHWLSFDRYGITNGIVPPEDGAAVRKQYDPWLQYHPPGRRRRDRGVEQQQEGKLAPAAHSSPTMIC